MGRITRTTVTLAVLAAVASAFAGCLSGGDRLEGTEWRLTEWAVSSIDPASVTITAEFADGQLSGTAGVNIYSGPYSTGAEAGFSAGPFSVTEMAGPEPAMRAEAAYLELLGRAESYVVTASRLTLFDVGGNESLVFERSGS